MEITELPIQVVRGTVQSLPAQLAEQIRQLIRNGSLKPATKLPASRVLAERIAVSRGTVVAAYEQLIAEGYLVSTGRNTLVASGISMALPQQKTAETKPNLTPVRTTVGGLQPANKQHKTINLQPGGVDTSALASAAWRSAWRSAAAHPTPAMPVAGAPTLQLALAEHLQLTRTLLRDPHEILITSGAREGLRQLLGAYSGSNTRTSLTVAVETPGFPSLQRVPVALGHKTLAIPVDEHGLVPAFLPRGTAAPEIVLVTPSHQYPLGASMPLARRIELLEWAKAHGSIIIEDDYDSELRYTGDPLPALAALDEAGEYVATLGSFTKLLHGGVGVGYLVAPKKLQPALQRLRADLGSTVSAVAQTALAEFFHTGAARRHIAKMRRAYRTRRTLVANCLPAELLAQNNLELVQMAGGLHTVLRITRDAAAAAAEEDQLRSAIYAAGVSVSTLSAYWSASPVVKQTREHGIVIGFGGVTPAQLQTGLQRIAAVLIAQVSK